MAFAVIFYFLLQIPNLPLEVQMLLKAHFVIYMFLNILNLRPIRPLDGAEVLTTLIGWKKGSVNEQLIEKVSYITGFICAAIALFLNDFLLATMAGYLAYRSYKLSNARR